MKRSLLVVVLAVLMVMAMGASAALAGEVNGNGDPTAAVENANSICAFSGLNDFPDDPFPDDGRTQSYGQLVKKGVVPPKFFNPGDACRGGSNPHNP